MPNNAIECKYCTMLLPVETKECPNCGRRKFVNPVAEITAVKPKAKTPRATKLLAAVLGGVVLAILGLAGFVMLQSTGGAGSAACNAYIEEINEATAVWDDAWELATSTPRMAISGRIAELQVIKRNMERVEVPSCDSDILAKEKLVRLMESGIDVMLAFSSDNSTDGLIILYDRAFEDAEGALLDLNLMGLGILEEEE